MSRRTRPHVDAAIEAAAKKYGLDPSVLRSFAQIESGGDPRAQTGSYQGLFQLGPREWATHGADGDPFDPQANAMAAGSLLASHRAEFVRKYGQEPTPAQLYMIHQQGTGGAAQHWANPDRPAWENMYSTAEGQARGRNWARAAIWGNLPADQRRQFGDVDNVTSRDFTNFWADRLARAGHQWDNTIPQATNTSGPSIASSLQAPPAGAEVGGVVDPMNPGDAPQTPRPIPGPVAASLPIADAVGKTGSQQGLRGMFNLGLGGTGHMSSGGVKIAVPQFPAPVEEADEKPVGIAPMQHGTRRRKSGYA